MSVSALVIAFAIVCVLRLMIGLPSAIRAFFQKQVQLLMSRCLLKLLTASLSLDALRCHNVVELEEALANDECEKIEKGAIALGLLLERQHSFIRELQEAVQALEKLNFQMPDETEKTKRKLLLASRMFLLQAGHSMKRYESVFARTNQYRLSWLCAS